MFTIFLFRVFSRSLSADEIGKLASCDRSLHLTGDIIDINEEPANVWNLVGEAEETTQNFDIICSLDK